MSHLLGYHSPMIRKKRPAPPRVHLHALDRLMRICNEIRGGGYPNKSRLAGAVERHQRTVQRYLDALRDQFNAPLVFDRERNGYRLTDPNWQLSPIRLSEGELIGFFAAERILRRLGNSPEAQLAREALKRLAVLLPKEVVIDIAALDQAINYAPAPVLDTSPGILEQLTSAALNRRTLRMSYYSQHRVAKTMRKIDVLVVHDHLGEWYAIAYDHLSGEVRDFHAGRILKLEQTHRTFDLPKNWDRETYLRSGFGMFRGGNPVVIEVEFDSDAGRYIRERKFHPTEVHEELQGGRLCVRFETTEAALGQVARWLMQYGRHAKVIEPEALRNMIREEVAAMVVLYGRK